MFSCFCVCVGCLDVKGSIYLCVFRVRETRAKEKGGKLKEKGSAEKSGGRSRKRSPSPKKTKGKVVRGRDKRRRRNTTSSSRYLSLTIYDH